MKLKLNINAGMQASKFQKGFIAAEVAISITIGMAVLAYAGNVWYKTKVNERDDESAMRVADYVSAISGSLATYTSDNNTQIQSKAAIGTIPGSRVQNPTLQDLVNVANLNARYLNPVTYKTATINFVPSVVVDTSNGCTVPNCMLTYSVRTTDFLPSQKDSTVPDIGRTNMVAAKISSTRAGVSLPATLGNPSQFVAAGGILVGTNPTNQPGLIYAENVFDTQMLRPFLRRDGSLPMTGSLNMQDTAGTKHNINNAATVNTETLAAKDVNATNVTSTKLKSNDVQTDTLTANSGKVTTLDSTTINSSNVINANGEGVAATKITANSGNIIGLDSYLINNTVLNSSSASISRLYNDDMTTKLIRAEQAYATNQTVLGELQTHGRVKVWDSIELLGGHVEGAYCDKNGSISSGYIGGSHLLICQGAKWSKIQATMDIIQGGGYIAGLKPGKRYVVSINGVTGHRGNDGAWLTAVRVTDSSGNLLAQAHDPVYINWHDGMAPHSGTVAVTAPADGVIYGYTDNGGAYSMVAMGGF